MVMRHGTKGVHELEIERVFNAPPEEVWKAITDPDLIRQWWGPKSFTAPTIRNTLRKGGRYFYCMRSRDGKDYCSTGRFDTIDRPNHLVYTDSFADEKGKAVPASHYGMKGAFPDEMTVDITLEEDNGKTRLYLCHIGMPAGKNTTMARQGWNESFDKLDKVLAALRVTT